MMPIVAYGVESVAPRQRQEEHANQHGSGM